MEPLGKGVEPLERGVEPLEPDRNREMHFSAFFSLGGISYDPLTH